MNITNTQILTDFLDKKNISYTVDSNPSPEKVNRIKKAIERKESLMNNAVSTYKQVFGR